MKRTSLFLAALLFLASSVTHADIPQPQRVDQRDGRCVVITVDPDTGERSPEILRTVEDQRQGCLGVYGSTVTPGTVSLNDSVCLEKSSEES